VAALGREPTVAEHRAHAHAHAFIDMVLGDEEQAGAVWAWLPLAIHPHGHVPFGG